MIIDSCVGSKCVEIKQGLYGFLVELVNRILTRISANKFILIFTYTDIWPLVDNTKCSGERGQPCIELLSKTYFPDDKLFI